MRGIERTEHTAFVVLLAEHVLRQRKYCRRLARARWTVEEQVRQVARFHGVLQRRHHLAPRTWALAGAPCPARSGVAGVLCAQGAAQGVDANTTESGEQTWSCCWRSSIVAGRYFSTHGASALVTSAGALAVFGSESSISWSSDIVSTGNAGRNEDEKRKGKSPRNQTARNSVILRPVHGEMQSVRDEVWGPVRQRGEQHACVRLVTNLQVPVPPVHALPLRSRRPAPRGLALTNLRLCSQARLGLAHRSHAHTQPPLPLTHCEQGSGEWTAPDKTPPRRRQHSSLVFTFVLVLVASCLLVAWSLYAWHMHEDKQRLEQSNRRLALRLQEAEDDIRKLQELTLKLNAHPPPAPHDADAAKPLPPAPPGPEPQQPDTQILRGEGPGVG